MRELVQILVQQLANAPDVVEVKETCGSTTSIIE